MLSVCGGSLEYGPLRMGFRYTLTSPDSLFFQTDQGNSHVNIARIVGRNGLTKYLGLHIYRETVEGLTVEGLRAAEEPILRILPSLGRCFHPRLCLHTSRTGISV